MEKISTKISYIDEEINNYSYELKYVNRSKFISLAKLGVLATLVTATNYKYGISLTSCLVSIIGFVISSFHIYNFIEKNDDSKNLSNMINNLNEYKAKLLRDKKRQECSKAIGSRRNVTNIKTSNELVEEYFNSK